MNKYLFLLSIFIISGCETTAPLVPVSYEKEASVTTSQTATITLFTGMVTGSSGSTLATLGNNQYMSVPTKPVTSLHFGEEDQLTFISSLAFELSRLGILNVLEFGQDTTLDSDQVILVLFKKTHHDPHHQVYTLDVVFKITSPYSSFSNLYRIVSHSSMRELMFTNASQGKEKAATKLLYSLIEDIQLYLQGADGYGLIHPPDTALSD